MNDTNNNHEPNSTQKIEGVREYFHSNSEILFVQEMLPLVTKPQKNVFSTGARKMWQAFYEVGLITKLFTNTAEAEKEVFERGLFTTSGRPYSLATLSWENDRSPKGFMVILGSWPRLLDLCDELNVNKLVYLGRKIAIHGVRDFDNWDIKRNCPYGFLLTQNIKGRQVKVFGLPMKGINKETMKYFKALNE